MPSFRRLGEPFRGLGTSLGSLLGSPIKWLLRDDFNDTVAAGSVNGTSATPGPGTRTVTDTNSKISVGSGVLDFATGAAVNDGYRLDAAVARASGQVVVFEMTESNTNGRFWGGWHRNAGTGLPRDGLALDSSAGVKISINASSFPFVGTYAGSTSYKFAVVMKSVGHYYFIKGGAYTNWTLLYTSNLGSEDPAHPIISVNSTTTIATSDFIRVPTQTWLPTPLAYDTFTRADGAIGNSETTGPDSQTVTQRAWTGATWTVSSNKSINTPNLGSELVTNGNMETGDPPSNWLASQGTNAAAADERTGGAGAQSSAFTIGAFASGNLYQLLTLTVGAWYLMTGWQKKVTGDTNLGVWNSSFGQVGITTTSTNTNWNLGALSFRPTSATNYIWGKVTGTGNEGRFDDISTKALTLSQLFASLTDSTTANVHVSADLVVTAGTQAGLVLNLDSAASPANFVIVYHDGTNVKIEKCVAGTYTTVASTTTAYSAGAKLVVNKIGTAYRVYYNNALVGSSNTISDAGIVDNTIHGTFSTYASNTIDNFELFASNSGHDTFLNRVTT